MSELIGKNVIATTVHMFMGRLERIERIGEIDVAVIRTHPPSRRGGSRPEQDGLRWVPLDGKNNVEGDISAATDNS